MKDMLITKGEIIAAAAELIRASFSSLHTPDERRGIKMALFALADNTPDGSELSELFRVCGLSIPIYRNCSIYENKVLDLEYNLKKAGFIE